MSNTPCRGCNYRHLGCHSNCSKYIDWKLQMEVLKEQEREQRKCDYDAMKKWRPRR